ncbi:MAG: SpoIVB peptidase S55 domain-containing protein [bacterium]
MKKFIPILLLLTCFSLGSTAASAAETLPVSKLEAGMKGYGKTVLSGKRVDTFPVEILGVMKKVMPDQDLILIRAENDTLVHTNIISGMSGSPIYINGKLIGALAYSWPFEKEPIAGVTPIKNIRNTPGDFKRTSGDNSFKKITTPLVTSGFSEESLESISGKFKKMGLPVQFINGGNPGQNGIDSGAIKNIEPGSAVGIQLIRGDLNMAAIGTATEIDRENNRLYAFGHPFLNSGEIEFPMTTARVQTFIPSLQSSFKIASPEKTIGVITTDRQATVAGELGKKADLIPVKINLNNPAQQAGNSYSVEIIRNKFLTPGLLNSVAANFARAKIQQLGVNKITTNIQVELANHPNLDIQRVTAASQPLDYRPFLELQQLWLNKFQKPEIEKIALDITLERGEQTARITDLWTNRAHVVPGEKITVFAKLEPHRKDEVIKSFDFRLPDDLPGRQIRLSATSAGRLSRQKPAPESLAQVIEFLNNRKNNTGLAVVIAYPGLNMNFYGKRYKNIPPGFARMLRPENNQDIRAIPASIKKIIDTGWLLSGKKSIELPVKSK